MITPTPASTGSAFLNWLLLHRRPGTGEELGGGLRGPGTACDLFEDPGEVGELIDAVQSRGGGSRGPVVGPGSWLVVPSLVLLQLIFQLILPP
jgi:hypothetical protein